MTKDMLSRIAAGDLSDALRSWVIVLLTLAFVLLYALALIGKIKPLADVTIVSRLEPILFVIIGYYFGRLPARQNEQTLKDQIETHRLKAEAADQRKDAALRGREALDEKVKNARTVLEDGGSGTVAELKNSEMPLPYSVATALKILKT
jgi:choline-glycine betaine transporter